MFPTIVNMTMKRMPPRKTSRARPRKTSRPEPRRRARGRQGRGKSQAPKQAPPRPSATTATVRESEVDPSPAELRIFKREQFAILACLLDIPLHTEAGKEQASLLGQSLVILIKTATEWQVLLETLPHGPRKTYMLPDLSIKQIAVKKNRFVRQNCRENLASLASEFLIGRPKKQSTSMQLTAAKRILHILFSLAPNLSFIYGSLCPETEKTDRVETRPTVKTEEKEEIRDKVADTETVEDEPPDNTKEDTPELLRISEAAKLANVSRKTIYLRFKVVSPEAGPLIRGLRRQSKLIQHIPYQIEF